MPNKRRNNKTYRDLSQALKRKGMRNQLPCWICGQPIDYDLPWKHPMSYTYDHIDAVAAGGSMRGEGRPAHRSCNSRRGAGRGVTSVTTPRTTRDW